MAGSPPPTAKSVGFTVSSLGLATSAAFTAALQPLGLSPRDFALMRSIAAEQGLSQQALGERLQIPASRMVAFIDGLEASGMVERRLNPDDRRTRAIHLTPSGLERLERALGVAEGFERNLVEGLDEHEREQLLALLHRVGEQLGVAPGVHAGHGEPTAAG
jgi:DNA-binding MarR family transcriptional regulator